MSRCGPIAWSTPDTFLEKFFVISVSQLFKMSQMAQNKDAPQNSQRIQPENEGLNRTQSSNSSAQLGVKGISSRCYMPRDVVTLASRPLAGQPWCQLIKLFLPSELNTQIPYVIILSCLCPLIRVYVQEHPLAIVLLSPKRP